MFTFASRPLLPAFAGRARGRSDRRKRPSSRQNQKSSGGLCARQFAPEPAGLLFPSPSQRIGAAVEFFDVGFIFRLHPLIRGVHRHAEHGDEQDDDNRDDGLLFHRFTPRKVPEEASDPSLFYYRIALPSIRQGRLCAARAPIGSEKRRRPRAHFGSNFTIGRSVTSI